MLTQTRLCKAFNKSSALTLNFGTQTSGSGGGGGGGGSGGGGGGGGAGGTGNNGTSLGANIPQVDIAPVSAGRPERRSPSGGRAGQNVGLNFVTRIIDTVQLDTMVRSYFTTAGVNLNDPGKSVFFNDRLGLLLVRASATDLEIIEEAVEVLNQMPPQVTIEAKFAELSQQDSRALGFNCVKIGNTLLNKGAIGVQGGTAPSYQGASTTANPSGVFPGPSSITPGSTVLTPSPGQVVPAASDGNLTSGLRNSYGPLNNPGTSPTVGTITGIMTDPQFRVAINAIEQRTGSDLLAAPKVTTLSGRQAHVAAQDLQEIVTGTTTTQTGSSTGGLTGGTGVGAPQIGYTTTFLALGPVLDVIPTVSADGYSIQMVLIPTYTEFLQYDPPGAFIPQAEAAAGNTIGDSDCRFDFAVAALPRAPGCYELQRLGRPDNCLGRFDLRNHYEDQRQSSSAGRSAVGGSVVPGSQSSDSIKDNLVIFVTPTIIDPAGNRVHNDDDLPFAHNPIPSQPMAAPAVSR